jgi:chromosome segregation ATPase
VEHSDRTLLHAGGQTGISDRMRELLARAAQDHVYEQRTQGAALEEIRQRLEGMEWLLRELRERELGGLSGSLESVSGRLDDIRSRPPLWAEGLAQHVEAVRDHVDVVAERIGDVRDHVGEVRDHVGEVRQRVDDVGRQVGEQVKPLAELPSLWADLGTVGESVDETRARVLSVAENVEGMLDRMDDLAGQLGRIQAHMEAAAGRFSRLDRAVGELTERTERVEGGIERVDGRVEEVAGRTERIGTTVDGLGGRLATMDVRMEALDECLADIDTRIGGVEGRVADLATQADETNEHLEAIDEHVTTIDQRIGGLPTVADLAEGHRRVTELLGAHEARQERRLDSVDERLADAVARLTEAIEARPDGEGLTTTLSTTLAQGLAEVVHPAHDDVTRRLAALEETMLALAEALLRPARGTTDSPGSRD